MTDPLGPPSGEWRVLRGGSWFSEARYLRSACRAHGEPGDRYDDFGFRLALGPELTPAGQAGGERGRTVRAWSAG
ncbi:MAG: SUMF1/EgtB/PvdO family nonheme iron enzyme [Chromatiaceae bacterium]